MKDWRKEHWETLSREGDNEVGKIFERLFNRELSLIQAFTLLELVPHQFEDVDMCKETINKFIDHIVKHIGEDEQWATDIYQQVRDEISLAYWAYDEFRSPDGKNLEEFWKEEAEGCYSKKFYDIVADVYKDVMNNDTLWANSFADYWKHKKGL